MKDLIFDEFQNSIDSSLLRHKSILDILTKLQESEARVNRSVIKSVTNCGCIKINAQKQSVDFNICTEESECEHPDINLSSHIDGNLCDNCRNVVEQEIGNHLFYLTSLCNALDLNLYDILLTEYKKTKTFDKISLR